MEGHGNSGEKLKKNEKLIVILLVIITIIFGAIGFAKHLRSLINIKAGLQFYTSHAGRLITLQAHFPIKYSTKARHCFLFKTKAIDPQVTATFKNPGQQQVL